LAKSIYADFSPDSLGNSVEKSRVSSSVG